MYWWKFREKKKIYVSAATDIGAVRTVNQDNLYLMEEVKEYSELEHFQKQETHTLPVLYAVCDGMGGGDYGEEASRLAISMLGKLSLRQLSEFSDAELEQKLKEYIQTVNDKIYNGFHKRKTLTGSTIVLFYADHRRICIINVGDSPAFRCSADGLTLVTCLDNHADQLYRMGIISAQERWTHKTKSSLTQFLGMNPQEMLLSPHVYMEPYPQMPVTYLLCSDGLLDGMEIDALHEAVVQCPEGNPAKELVKRALAEGSRDNVTAVLVACGSIKGRYSVKDNFV